MAGHSKWAGIKHKKALVDAQRSRVFSKVVREITVAARQSGNPEANPRLRLAIAKAREHNMPKDQIERAIKKGTGELPGVTYEETMFEGYGPGGVAILVEALTDNKNRASAEIRNIFMKRGGSLGGSVAWLFTKKGYLLVSQQAIGEERLMSLVLEHGAEDLSAEGESFAVTTPLQQFEAVKKALQEAKIPVESAQVTMLPSNLVKVDGAAARQVLALVESLEEHDDVQNVYANFDIPEALLQESQPSS
ncbi:MAG: YebC/PmpR family DNA-binding transcriptional regulator [Candidatus Omnitrophica bacterium]|nr:YebC/PmpR family DNA-binding transcriptional regulator [Candidatus Omnitrophota bacterium]